MGVLASGCTCLAGHLRGTAVGCRLQRARLPVHEAGEGPGSRRRLRGGQWGLAQQLLAQLANDWDADDDEEPPIPLD